MALGADGQDRHSPDTGWPGTLHSVTTFPAMTAAPSVPQDEEPPTTAPTATARWIRVSLAALMVGAGAVYAAGIPLGLLHDYYSPAVYTMAHSWSAFFWGAADTAQSITLDKLPFAFQLQALSVRLFGWSDWSVLMPQVLLAVATIGVMFATVRRWAGNAAGLLAAAAYALTPIVAALAHSQIVDTMLTFLLVCAAYFWTRAVESGRLVHLLGSAVFVGLAFNTKMAQAWGVLPALAIAYLLFAPGSIGRRLGQLVVTGLVTLAASLWWVVVASLVPADSRPWIDGAPSNSPWEMVFGYNLFDRYAVSTGSGGGPGGGVPGGQGGATYLLQSSVATQVGWLLPMALAGLVLAIATRRGRPRTDLLRAGAVMWALWLVTFSVAFSAGRVAHSFYVVALAPPLVALAAAGATLGWRAWVARRRSGWVLPVALVATSAWSLWLQSRYAGFLPWLAPLIVALGVLALAGLVATRYPAYAGRGPRLAVAGVAAAATLAAPAAWALSTTQAAYSGASIGPAAGPAGGFGPPGGSVVRAQRPGMPSGPTGGPPPGGLPAGQPPAGAMTGGPGGFGGFGDGGDGKALLDWIRKDGAGSRYDVAVVGGGSSGSAVTVGGRVIAVGGFTGSMPNVTAARLAEYVESGELRHVLLGGRGGGPGGGSSSSSELTTWVTSHCTAVTDAPTSGLYRCGS